MSLWAYESTLILLIGCFQGEGVAYRGRVLVELSTQLEGKADKEVDKITSDDIMVVQVKTVALTQISLSLWIHTND